MLSFVTLLVKAYGICNTERVEQINRQRTYSLMSTIVNDAILTTLNAAQYKRRMTVIPNDHPRIAPHVQHLPAIAESLGVDFQKTGYTFKVNTPEEGLKKVITPSMGTYKGKVVLHWGNTFTPIENLKGKVSVGLDGKRVIFSVETDDEIYRFESYLRKDVAVEDIELKRLLKAKKLHEVVDDLRLIPDSMATLKPNVMYEVTGYNIGSYEGKKTYSLQLKGLGFYSANSNIINRLADDPEITEEKPGKLMVGEVTKTTPQGHPVVPILHFSTYAETELEEYTFD